MESSRRPARLLTVGVTLLASGCSLLFDPSEGGRGEQPQDSSNESADGGLSPDSNLVGTCPPSPFPDLGPDESLILCFLDQPDGEVDTMTSDGQVMTQFEVGSDTAPVIEGGTLVLSEEARWLTARAIGPLVTRCAERGDFTAEIVFKNHPEQPNNVGGDDRFRILELWSQDGTYPEYFALGTDREGINLDLLSGAGESSYGARIDDSILADKFQHLTVTYAEQGSGTWMSYISDSTVTAREIANIDLAGVEEWTRDWDVSINIGNTHDWTFYRRQWWGRVAFIGLYCDAMGQDLALERQDEFIIAE